MASLHWIFFDRKDDFRNGWWALAYLPFACFALLLDRWLGSLVLILAALALLKLQARPLRELGVWPDRRWLLDFGFGLLCGGGILALAALVSRGFGGFHWERNADASLSLLLAGAWLYLAVAVYEELLFHGYLLRRAVDGLGLWPGLLLMGFVFAKSHWENPGITSEAALVWATVNICLAGLLLGLGYLRFRTLAWPMGAHLGWNWTQGNLLGFAVSGTTDTPGWWRAVPHPGHAPWLTGGAFGLEASLPCALICGAGVVALALWKGRPNAAPSTDGASGNLP
ncbi:MAG TPA: CPBP family glutamic-type intramembrane protease [Holophagaceae bacterium]|nr:CPBP family glutamic-type intramembrane protease [Holophagaceae bacterium]